jgi:hypothetical protein
MMSIKLAIANTMDDALVNERFNDIEIIFAAAFLLSVDDTISAEINIDG